MRQVVRFDMYEVDLSDLSRGYEHRPLSSIARARAKDAAVGRSGVLLDVGGGAGEHARQWTQAGLIPLLIDPSARMCRRAAQTGSVIVVRAVAQAMPIVADSANLAYFHLSLHYGSWPEAIDEAARVVAPGGVIEIWTFEPRTMASSALARWFPRIGEIDQRRFPGIVDIVDRLNVRGAAVAVTSQPELVRRSAGSWIAAVENRFVSTIQFLVPAEIEEGIRRFSAAFPDPDEPYSYTLEFVRIRATMRPLR